MRQGPYRPDFKFLAFALGVVAVIAVFTAMG